MDLVLSALSNSVVINDECSLQTTSSSNTSTVKLFQQAEQQLLARDSEVMTGVLERGLASSNPHQKCVFVLFLDYLLQSEHLSADLVICMIKDHSTFFTTIPPPSPSIQVAKVLLKWHDNGYLDLAATRPVLEGIIREGEAVRQARRQFMEMIEKDREKQRGLREMDWQCFDPSTECDDYFEKARHLTDYEQSCILYELSTFHKRPQKHQQKDHHQRNHSTSPTRKRTRTGLDFSRIKPATHCFLFHLQCFDNIIQPQCEQLFEIVCKLARIAFFYDDLQELNQVHVDYYQSEDDHCDLRIYDFEKDDLGQRKAGRSHYLLERALRMRKSVQRYDRDPQRCADRLDKAELRHFYSALKDQGDLIESCRMIDAVASWGFRVVVAVDLHISLILSLFALLNPRKLSAAAFYSLQNKDLNYVEKKAKEFINSHHRLTIIKCPEDVSLVEIKSFLN